MHDVWEEYPGRQQGGLSSELLLSRVLFGALAQFCAGRTVSPDPCRIHTKSGSAAPLSAGVPLAVFLDPGQQRALCSCHFVMFPKMSARMHGLN